MKRYIRSNSNHRQGPFSTQELEQFFLSFLGNFVPNGLHLDSHINYVFPENFTGDTDVGFNSYNTVTCRMMVDPSGKYKKLKNLVENINKECFYLQVRVSPDHNISAYRFRMKFYKSSNSDYNNGIFYHSNGGNMRDYSEFRDDFGADLSKLPIDSSSVLQWFQEVKQFLDETLNVHHNTFRRFKRHTGDTYRWNSNNIVPESVVVDSEHENVVNFIEDHLQGTENLHVSNIVQTDASDYNAFYDITLTDSRGNSFTYSTEFIKYGDEWSNASEGFDVGDSLYELLEEYCTSAGIDLDEFEDV